MPDMPPKSSPFETPHAPARDAATVLLCREGKRGLEVFMVRRHSSSGFAGGAYVFPGGKVDDGDRSHDLSAVCWGRTDTSASARLGIPSGGLAFWVAAVRECFEEAGVLLARRLRHKGWVSLVDVATTTRFDAHRVNVTTGVNSLAEVCLEENLVLDLGAVEYLSHWITPSESPQRFDTRFFVAAAPAEQATLHDDYETTASIWLTPAEGLAGAASGELPMMFPTVRTLEQIRDFERLDRLLAWCATDREIPAWQPRAVVSDGKQKMLLPGDEGYDEAH